MNRIVFAACFVALAGLSLPAFAQSFDETVSYIQDRCVGLTVDHEMDPSTGLTMTSHTLLAFNADEGGSIEFRYRGRTGLTFDYRVSMSDVVRIEYREQNQIGIWARPDSAQVDALDDTRGAYSVSLLHFYCPNPDRIVRALEHLVSLADDDPFAN